MTNLRAAAQQALKALEQCGLDDTHRNYEFEHAARAALRAALAEPVQEPIVPSDYSDSHQPVAWMDIAEDGTRLSVRMWSDGNREEVALFTARVCQCGRVVRGMDGPRLRGVQCLEDWRPR